MKKKTKNRLSPRISGVDSFSGSFRFLWSLHNLNKSWASSIDMHMNLNESFVELGWCNASKELDTSQRIVRYSILYLGQIVWGFDRLTNPHVQFIALVLCCCKNNLLIFSMCWRKATNIMRHTTNKLERTYLQLLDFLVFGSWKLVQFKHELSWIVAGCGEETCSICCRSNLD